VPGAVPGGVVDDGRPTIALTFDDGPHTEYTRRVLEELSKRRVVATFCPIGIHVRRCPEVLREIVLQGSEIGNHTWSHQILTRLTPDLIAADVEQLQQRVEALTGRRPTFLRPPGGSYNNTVIAAARLPVVCWSVDPKDWQGVDAATVAAHIIEHARDGDIILQHDTHATSYEALNLVLDELIARGFRFVTVSQLLGFGGPDSPQSGVWRSRG
jgi:peptidoglycan/xylan/chitin deacetylase (PgdA/CDA1 family)